MKCQILFSRKNKKNISKCRLLQFLPSVQSVKKSGLWSIYGQQRHRSTCASLHSDKELLCPIES